MAQEKYIAHIRKEDNKKQSVKEHIKNVSALSASNASKIGFAKAGELIGLLHDFGKYSETFQNYIGSATGLIEQDEDEYVNSKGLKGKIDHSTAGAQYIWKLTKGSKIQKQIVAQLLALSIASHHSGLIDCLKIDGEMTFADEWLNQIVKPI